jgi:MinD-like ATPase involved in chromosome partitioning or flagellar assembly
MQSYTIRVSSQKGGVGKTTVAVNLSVALQMEGYKVLLIDADTVNPSVGFHLGFSNVNIGIKELLTKNIKLADVRVVHTPTGLHVVPGVLSQKEYIPTEEMLERMFALIKKTDYNFVIIDTSPGYTLDKISKFYDEALLVSTPEMASVANIIRLSTWFDKMNLKHNLVLNKVKNKSYELHVKEIEEMYESRITELLPDTEIVPISIEEHIPAYIYKKNCNFSNSIRELAHFYGAKSEVGSEIPIKRGFFAWLSRLFSRN